MNLELFCFSCLKLKNEYFPDIILFANTSGSLETFRTTTDWSFDHFSVFDLVIMLLHCNISPAFILPKTSWWEFSHSLDVTSYFVTKAAVQQRLTVWEESLRRHFKLIINVLSASNYVLHTEEAANPYLKYKFVDIFTTF